MFRHDSITQPLAPASAGQLNRRRGRHVILGVVLAAPALVACATGLLISMDPAILPQAVDGVRAIVGPGPVALVESLVFQAKDTFRQARYQATGSASHVQWTAPPAPAPVRHTPASQVTPARQPIQTAGGRTIHNSQSTIQDQIAWSPFVYISDGQPVLERALVSPDPTRPYVETALVRIDLRYARLHLIAGTQEPISKVRMPRPGAIPAADQKPGRLLAAFNGGFKAANGDFGMGVGGTTLLPPIDRLATLAIYHDGHVAMGAWGVDLRATQDMTAFRQNCPLLLDRGAPTEAAFTDDAALWGSTVRNKIATWRSGLGLSADGRYLIYTAGDGLTVPALAQALALAGAGRAMQLDINSWWTRFVTYAPGANGRLAAQKLLTDMVGDARQFLAPDTRDFFYVTAR